jgi:DNA polymerase-3 subunit epsilon
MRFPAGFLCGDGMSARAIEWAKQRASDTGTVYLDTETTGLGPDAEIVDIALIGADGRVLLDTLVQPLGAIPEAASAIHGLTAEHLVSAPLWADVAGAVLELISGRTVVVYNAEYDFRIVQQCCRRYGVPEPEAFSPALVWDCAMRAFSDYMGARRWHKLDAAAAQFGHPPGGHRALGDALACRSVVLGMAGS